MNKLKEYNYNKDEVIIETKRTEKGETYKVYYENKKYFFGLFSQKGDKISDGIVLHYYISDDDPTHSRTTIKDGVRTKQEHWKNEKKFEEITYKKEGVLSSQKKKTPKPKKKIEDNIEEIFDEKLIKVVDELDDNYEEKDLFNSINKEFGTDFKQNDYIKSVPIEQLEKIDNLVYYQNKLYSGFITYETFDKFPKKIMEYKNGIEGGKFKEFYENGQIKLDSNIINGQPHGENKEYYENGELMMEGSFKEGKNEGLWKGYYENGKKKIEEEYKDGINHGIYKKYYENGKLYQETTFNDGENDGLYMEYKEDGSIHKKTLFKKGEEIMDYPEVDNIDESKEDIKIENNIKGELQKTYHEGTENIESEYYIDNGKRNGPMKVFYESGQLRTEMNFKNDLPDGKGTGYFENGKISTVNSFKLGKEHGEFISYHENGQVHSKYNFLDGLEDGGQENWYENGQLDIEKNMKNGEQNGWSRNYFNNGQIEFEGEYSEGEPIGSHKTWDEDGDLIDEKIYKDSEFISVEKGKNTTSNTHKKHDEITDDFLDFFIEKNQEKIKSWFPSLVDDNGNIVDEKECKQVLKKKLKEIGNL